MVKDNFDSASKKQSDLDERLKKAIGNLDPVEVSCAIEDGANFNLITIVNDPLNNRFSKLSVVDVVVLGFSHLRKKIESFELKRRVSGYARPKVSLEDIKEYESNLLNKKKLKEIFIILKEVGAIDARDVYLKDKKRKDPKPRRHTR